MFIQNELVVPLVKRAILNRQIIELDGPWLPGCPAEDHLWTSVFGATGADAKRHSAGGEGRWWCKICCQMINVSETGEPMGNPLFFCCCCCCCCCCGGGGGGGVCFSSSSSFSSSSFSSVSFFFFFFFLLLLLLLLWLVLVGIGWYWFVLVGIGWY